MTGLRIGTSGFDYLDWKESFYPPGMERAHFLNFYGTRFSTVELNFSYYRMPTQKQLQAILEKSGETMDFSIKANESMTHKIAAGSWKGAVKEYMGAIAPLHRAGRLAAVLLQFPYSFHYVPDNRQYLDRLVREMHELPLAVEFRNAEWFNGRVFDALRERKVALCSVDAPPLKGLPPPVDIVTAPLAYVRFHGRNEKTWWGSDAAARFDYFYDNDELRAWISRIIAMLGCAVKMRVYFNNHRRGQAPANAQMLKELLAGEGIDMR